MESLSLRIVVAHQSEESRARIVEGIRPRHEVVGVCATVAEIKRTVAEGRPDLIVIGVEFPDGDGVDAAIELGVDTPLPTVVTTVTRSLDVVKRAMRDHVMAYLIEPVKLEDLEASIVVAWNRFNELQQLQAEVEDLRMALEHRKVIERAKGVVMASESKTEAEAFAELRRRAQDERRRLVDVARDVVDGVDPSR